QRAAVGGGESAGTGGVEDVVIPLRVDRDGDGGMVLRTGPDHRGTTDIDLFDTFVAVGTRGDGFGERVQVRDHQVDRGDIQVRERCDVVRIADVGQQAAVDMRVQRF